MSREKQIEDMAKDICAVKQNCNDVCHPINSCRALKYAERFYNAGYRKQDDEELIDKIATYFEKEDNWTKLKYAWNGCGKSVQLRDMLRDAITEAKMKGSAE